jgi:adenosylcobinamide-GDP ribazoletransferase
MDAWWAAVRLLTCLPTPRPREYTPATLVRSLVWFPVVGFLLGALLGAVELGVRGLGGSAGSSAVSCAVVVVLGLLCTRGSHVRGLMRVLGALFAGRTPETIAALMTRQTPTAFGVLTGMGAVLLRYALLLGISPGSRLWVLIVCTALSRSALPWVCWRFGYAEMDTAIAGYFGALAGPRDLLLVLPLVGLAFGTLGLLPAAAALVSTWLTIHLLAVWISRLLGGLTASTYEAIVEVGELAALASFAGLAHVGQT